MVVGTHYKHLTLVPQHMFLWKNKKNINTFGLEKKTKKNNNIIWSFVLKASPNIHVP